MPADPEFAAGERDYFSGVLDRGLQAADPDAWVLRKAMVDAFKVAQWATAADGDDPLIVEALRTAGQLGVVQLESLRGQAGTAPVRGTMIDIPLGLTPDGFAAGNWADALFAATAAGDAAAALRLARIDRPLLPSGPAGYSELAEALAAVWTGDGQAQARLVRSLERTDPAGLTGADADAALDLVVPAAAVLQAIIDDAGTGAVVDERIADGAQRFVDFWAATTPEGLLATPLCALCVLARALRIDVSVAHRVLPPAVIARTLEPIVGCPACSQPFDPAQSHCAWCGQDLAADAPLETDLGEWLASRRTRP